MNAIRALAAVGLVVVVERTTLARCEEEAKKLSRTGGSPTLNRSLVPAAVLDKPDRHRGSVNGDFALIAARKPATRVAPSRDRREQSAA
jgi:hypothetical protein